jgi:hypothetical protein
MYKLKAVGSSYHRDAIESIARNPDGLRALALCTAYLVPEDENEHDSHAVKVVVDGKTVGHLAKDYAHTYRSFFSELPPPVPTAIVMAAITGGQRIDGREYEYSVELDIPDSLKLFPASGPVDEEVTRAHGFSLPVRDKDGRYEVKVWMPVSDWDELHRTRAVEEWTTEAWRTVNFYAKNRQGIGLGFKLYELQKPDYERYFGAGPVTCALFLGSSRIATLRMQKAASVSSDA